ncbi:MAG: glycerophosphodiester phosphodiesterase [Acetobacteraceae bacterium]|nr:glycerophosphodiester phosphodiesterase [Acetobacteraceae bacterium]
MPHTEIASHRGGAFHWPENSMLAFRHALAWPADQVEFDVHASADGEPVVFHDATLDRMTDAEGTVGGRSWEGLRAVRLRGTGGEGIPHLADVVSLLAASPQLPRLEIKADGNGRPYPGLVARCAAALDAEGQRGRCVLMSFQAATVAEAAALGGFRELVFLMESKLVRGMRPADAVTLARSCGATEIGVHVGVADAALLGACRSAGLRLSVWGANHAPTIMSALTLGLDAMATDDPPLALRLREAFEGMDGG